MKANILLAKLENLLSAVSELQSDETLGQGAQNKIDQIKNKVQNFIDNVNNVRKKVKDDRQPPSPCKTCPHKDEKK